VTDRGGISGAGGTTCAGDNAKVNPIFQFDTSGKLLKPSGRECSSAHTSWQSIRYGFLWLAGNGGHQVFKLSEDGKVLLRVS
jgi:hypothetical protein